MKLELDDFSAFDEANRKKSEIEQNGEGENAAEELEKFYQERISQLEKEYKELLGKVSKESYEQGFQDASAKYETVLKSEIERVTNELEKRKKAEIEEVKGSLLNIEEEFKKRYKEYVNRFTDIVIDSVSEILEFLYIDKSNSKKVQQAIEKLLEDFNNFLPLTLQVAPNMAEDVKKKFSTVVVKKNKELKNNEFVIEFHDFKIENRIKEKLGVIKDEIKRETKKLT